MSTITNTEHLHDLRLLELLREKSVVDQRRASHGDTVMRAAGFKRYQDRYDSYWYDGTRSNRVNVLDGLTVLDGMGDAWAISYSRKASDIAAEWRQRTLEADFARQAVVDHEKAYTGWPRYWLCMSSNGHVHQQACPSFRPTTRIALVPYLSGASVEATVNVFGAAMCSKCFPSAPVEWQDAVKVPASVATVLFEKGEEAFNEALAKYTVKATANLAKRCPGSGQIGVTTENAHRVLRSCPECGGRFRPGRNGVTIPAHNKPTS